jgi:hypothetical protein
MKYPVINLGHKGSSLGQTAADLARKAQECAQQRNLSDAICAVAKEKRNAESIRDCLRARQLDKKCDAEFRNMVLQAARNKPGFPEFGPAPYANQPSIQQPYQSYEYARMNPVLPPSSPINTSGIEPDRTRIPTDLVGPQQPSVPTQSSFAPSQQMNQQMYSWNRGPADCRPPSIPDGQGGCRPGVETEGGRGYGNLINSALNLGPSTSTAAFGMGMPARPLWRGGFR